MPADQKLTDAEVEALAPHVDPGGWAVKMKDFNGNDYYPGRAWSRKIARNVLMHLKRDTEARIAAAATPSAFQWRFRAIGKHIGDWTEWQD